MYKRQVAAQNWTLRRNTLSERLALVIAGLLLVFPSLLEAVLERLSGLDIPHPAPFGLALALAVVLKQKFIPAPPAPSLP